MTLIEWNLADETEISKLPKKKRIAFVVKSQVPSTSLELRGTLFVYISSKRESIFQEFNRLISSFLKVDSQQTFH